MQRYWIAAAVLLIIFVAVFMNRQESSQKENGAKTAENSEVMKSEEQAGEDDESTADEDAAMEESREAVASNENIVLLEPAPDSLVPSPFTVRGEARGIQGSVLTIRIVNKDKSIAINETARVRGGDEKTFGTFEIKSLAYVFTSAEEKTLEIFAVGQNGEELYKLSVPLRFTLTE
ncbi:hypothetical protein HYV71_03040 [Candidatus Uhrbacteria bacterium]|nr:hypothetical protein [Candidatus Uhrbacteria bacterium]